MAITFHSDVRFSCIIYRDPRNWTWKLSVFSNSHNFWLKCMIDAHDILRLSKLNYGSSWEIQMAITFHSDVRFTCIRYRDPRNWTRKLSANPNGRNFWLQCMIDANNISRHSKCNTGISRKIQMAITFHSDVRLTRIRYRDPRNWTWKLLANSNEYNFWLECMIDADYISRRSKLNNRSSREIQMAITFHSDVRFSCIIYRDPRNWTWKLSVFSNSHNFWLKCMIDAHDILRLSKLNYGSSWEIQMAITFHSDVRFTCIRYWDPRNWTWKLLANSNEYNCWLECMIDADYISRRSKLNNRSSPEIRNGYYFSLGCPIHLHQISKPSKLNTEALGKFKWP